MQGGSRFWFLFLTLDKMYCCMQTTHNVGLIFSALVRHAHAVAVAHIGAHSVRFVAQHSCKL